MNLTQHAYTMIKNKILNCKYPPGSKLNATMLMDDLHLTHTPIRSALRQLEFEGLLTIHAKQGITINAIEADDINQVTECMIMTLTHIIRHCSPWIDRNYLRELHKQMKEKWSVNLAADNLTSHTHDIFSFYNEFYEYLGSLTTNNLLCDFLTSLLEKKQRFVNMMGPERLTQYLNISWFTAHDTLDVVLALAEDRTEEAVEYMDTTMRVEGYSLLMAWIDANKDNISI